MFRIIQKITKKKYKIMDDKYLRENVYGNNSALHP